ncbi:MAG TPA: hypothetical protein PKB06_13180, partial [Actinotalea sp.]|nr:hypothetical protein [Actinotalea sp.]
MSETPSPVPVDTGMLRQVGEARSSGTRQPAPPAHVDPSRALPGRADPLATLPRQGALGLSDDPEWFRTAVF